MILAIRVDGLTLTYPFERTPALWEVSFRVAPGECILLLGPSGCGKSSLALTLNGLVPQSIPATVAGEVEVLGRRVGEQRVADFAGIIAYVFQDADSQLCALTVEDEIAFTLENRALPPDEIDQRTAAALDDVGLPRTFRTRRTQTLSGGEKQKVMLAAALAQDAAIYVFDEATSQLDPASTAETYRIIDRFVRARPERTVLFVDHKLDSLLPLIARVFLLDAGGRLVAGGPPAELFHDRYPDVAATGAWCPPGADLVHVLRRAGIALDGRPLTLSDAVATIEAYSARRPAARGLIRDVVRDWAAARLGPPKRGERRPLLRLERVHYALRRGPTLLADVSLTLYGGEILGLIGQNGAGKSTLGLVMAGLLRPTTGRAVPLVTDWPRYGSYVFQNPEHQFVAPTVREELLASLFPDRRTRRRAKRGGLAMDEQHVEATLRRAGLWERRDAHPFELSQGQKRALSVIAMAIVPDNPLLVLDEPSYGLDAGAVDRLRTEIGALRRDDRAIVLITHDMDLAAALCDRVAVLDQGRLARVDHAEAVFSDAGFLRAKRLAPPSVYEVRTWLDVAAA